MTEREITQLLREAADGDRPAMDALVERVYRDLERVAERQMHNRYGAGLRGVTLEPAALVNETFLKLLQSRVDFENRRHFFGWATQAMRRALIDYHRSRKALKRGGDQVRVTLSGLVDDSFQGTAAVLDLEAVIATLEELDARKAEVVKLRVYWGLEMTEIAEILGVSLATIERDWRFARNWLATALEDRVTRDGPADGSTE